MNSSARTGETAEHRGGPVPIDLDVGASGLRRRRAPSRPMHSTAAFPQERDRVAVPAAERVPAMAAAIWRNLHTGRPGTRSLIAYGR